MTFVCHDCESIQEIFYFDDWPKLVVCECGAYKLVMVHEDDTTDYEKIGG